MDIDATKTGALRDVYKFDTENETTLGSQNPLMIEATALTPENSLPEGSLANCKND